MPASLSSVVALTDPVTAAYTVSDDVTVAFKL